jgi:parvulin-like peptidyl-prolyl isomerase
MEGAKSRAEVYANMRGLRTELLAGADFLTVAERERGNEQQQIDLGWFKRGEFMEEFETIAFSMSEGELSPVFMTPLGFHICKVMARKPSGLVPYDQVKEAVQARVLETARDSKFNAFVEAQKAAATITDTAPDTESGCH